MGWNDVLRENKSTEKTPYTRFENGNTMIRILDDEPHSFWSHWLNKQQTSITCPGKGCPICNLIAQAKANKETPLYNSTQRHAIRIWNYNTNQMEVLIQGKNFFSNLLEFHKEVGAINSYDIKVIRKGSGTETNYVLLPQTPSEFDTTDKDIPDVDLSELLSPPTQEEILMLIEGKTWNEINGTDAA